MNVFLIVLAALIFLPIIAYMVMKFGTAGFLRAIRRDKEKQNHNPTVEENKP